MLLILLGALLLWAGGLVPSARAFNHPGIPLTKADLDYVKANLGVQPWKAGWDALQADPHASLSYVMQGPVPTVSRTPNINQNIWKNDMDAIYKLALRGYLSGDSSYSAKATTMIDAWATTMVSYGGNEGYLDLGDYAPQLFGGPEILRGTYSGWTQANTDHCVAYFNNAIKPALFGIPPYPARGANQGMAAIKVAMGLAAFCEDTTYWNQALFAFRNDAAGLPDTVPLGMVGDAGRDQGHTRGQFGHYAWGAAVAWAQGIDLFSENDNRIAKCAEYFSKYNLYNVVPYVTFGSIYGMYPSINSWSRGADLPLRNIITTAYETRKGVTLPWTDRMAKVWGSEVGFEYLKLSDTSTATYSPLASLPAPALATTDAWTDVDIGSPAQAGSSSFSNGVWTVKGGGAEVFTTGSDQFHFAYKAMTGDFVITARVLSQTAAGTYSKVGLMVRDSLSPTANFADVYMEPSAVEAAVRGVLGESHGDLYRNFAQSMPYWIKVERRGEWIGRFCSPDGINWQPINYAWTTMNSGSQVYVGLMACANDNTKLVTATMDNVAISGTGSGVAPAAPASLTGTAGQSQAMLSWVPSAGTTYCNVKRSTTDGGPYTTIASNVPAATYADMDLTNGSTYYYVVSGTNSVGVSANSAQISVTPSAAAAVTAAPANFTAFASDSTVDLSWSAVSGAISYNVKRATTSGGPYTRVFYGQDRELTNFTDMGLTNGSSYYYVVDAVNAFGESVNSAQATGAPLPALVWTGATSGTWDSVTSGNWVSSGTATLYQNGKPVQFDDSSASYSVTPTTTMTPSAVLINNSINAYSFNTTGIGGSTKVVKKGTGTLTMYASQPFTGGMSVEDPCTIWFWGGGTIGTGTVSVNANCDLHATSNGGNWAGTLPNSFLVASGATLTYDGDWKVAFNGNFSGAGTVTISPGYHASFCTLSGSNAGFAGAVNIYGAQPTLLNSVNAASANASWNILGGGNQLATNVSSGTFFFGELNGTSGIIYNNVTSSNTATLVIGNDILEDQPAFTGAISDNGSGKLAVTKVGGNTQIIGGANSYSGPTTINAGKMTVATLASGAGSYTVNTSGTLGVVNQADGSTLSASSLTLAAGTGLEFSNIQSLSTPIITASNVVVSGTCLVNVTDAFYLTSGAVYPLMAWNGTFTGSVSNFQLQLPSGWSGTLSKTSTQILLSVTGPVAASQTWSGTTSGNWSVSSNWGGVVPNNGDYLSFGTTNGATSLLNDLSGLIAGGLTFNSGAKPYTISGNTLYLRGDILNNSTATQTLSLPIILLANINVNTNTGAVVLSGEIDENVGHNSITKLGSGALTLTGSSTFSGGVNLNAGILVVAGFGISTQGPLGTGTLTLSGTTTIQYPAGAALYNNIVVAPGSSISLNQTTTGNSLSLYGNISGSGTITCNSSVNYGGTNLNGDNSGFTGTIILGGGNASRNRFGSANAGSANAKWAFYGVTDSPGLVSGVFQFGELSGNASNVRNDTTGTATLSIGALNTDSNWAGNLSSNGIIALTKVGTGTLTVSAQNDYIGATTINGGTLNVTGKLTGSGAVTVNSGGTLAGSGTIAGAVNLNSGAILSAGNGSTPGTLTLNGGLTVTGSSTLNFSLGSPTDLVALSGSYVAPSGGTATINLSAATGFGVGTYTLISGAAGISASDYVIGTMPTGYYCALTTSGSSLQVTVRIPGTSTWTGATSGTMSNATNWSGGLAPVPGDTLAFGSSTSTNSLTNDLSNFFVSGLLFNSGTGALTLSGSALQLGGPITNNSAYTQTITLPILLAGTSTITTNPGGNTLTGSISEIGGSYGLLKSGTGTLTIGGSTNTFSGGVTLQAGILAISGSGTTTYGPLGTGTLTMAGGILQHSSGAYLYNDIYAQPGTSSSFNEVTTGNSLFLYGNITGSGTLSTNASANYGGAQLCGDNSGFTGTFIFNGGNSARNKFGSSTAGSANAKWVLNGTTDSPSAANFGTGTIELGELSGNAGNIRNNTSGTATFSVGALGTDSTWAGVFSNVGSIALTKVGTGILTVSNANSYTGPTTVTGGTLNISGSLTGSGAVTINSGATLACKGKVAGAITVNNGGTLLGSGTCTGGATIATGGILSAGAAGVSGTLTVSSSLTLNQGAQLNLELSGTSTSDLISVSNTLTTSGTTTVNLTALSGFGAGTYPLITGTATISSSKFSLGTVPSGYGGVLSASNGMLSVTLIALPATPTALAATTRSSSVLLSWNAASGANTYNVFRSLTSGAGYSLVGSPSLTNFTDSAVTNGTTYYYVINASNAGGSSPYSVEVATTPSLLITTAEITSVTLSNSANPETLSIPASVLGHTYQLQYRDDLTSGSWSNTGSPQLGTGGSLQFGITPTTGVPKRFYRILIQRL